MSTINYDLRQKIISQALREIQFAREHKQNKTKNWKINEDLYYGRKVQGIEARANVDLGQMSSFVHTILSKIDNPLVFKFTKKKDAQVDRVKYLNALRTLDQQNDNWDIKDLAGKKQAVIYGRAVYSYYADSEDGYRPNLENIDVYDFLIDPSAGGIDVEKAFYLGNYGTVLTKSQLKEGIKKGYYLKTETQRLIEGASNATEVTQEVVNKQNRTLAGSTDSNPQKEISTSDKFKFWRWGTTYEGKRYFLLLSETGATAVEVCELTEKFASNMWWYWTWAAFIDLTEFWTPSYCDYVREIFMAQAVSINQMLDNSEQINKPQKIVNVSAIENLAQLKYRRDGVITVKANVDATKAIQFVQTPAITAPINVFQLLDAIQEKASGVTAGAKGVAEEDKVGIYEGNQENAADRFGLLNKSYAFGYKRFAKLYEKGVDEHLLKKEAVDILGPDGVKVVYISRRDIFRKAESFGITVEASNAEIALSEKEKQTKIAFLQGNMMNPTQNPQKAYEISASIAGFDDETIRQLQDTSDFGDASLMSKAERDIERILDGEIIKPFSGATTAYKQRFIDYIMDNEESIKTDDFNSLMIYVDQLDPIIIRNMTRKANEILFKQQMAEATAPVPTEGGGTATPAEVLPTNINEYGV